MAKKKMTETQKARLARRRKAARLSLQGLTLKEIAEKNQVSYATVRSDLEWIRKNEPQRLAADSADVDSAALTEDEAAIAQDDATPGALIESKPVDDNKLVTDPVDKITPVGKTTGESDDSDAMDHTVKTAGDDEHDLGEQEPAIDDHLPEEPARRVVYSNPVEASADPSFSDLLKDTARGTVGEVDGTGDIREFWEQQAVEAPDKTGEEEYFYSLSDTEKWRYMQDRLRNDRLMVVAVAFIILTVIVLLICS